MKIYIDADGCPVVDITIELANMHRVECIIFCDTAHVYERSGAKTITVSKGADSVDFALVNMVEKGDVVVTQDYGLAAMCLTRHAVVINQDGMEYTQKNIDSLLNARYTAQKIRKAGGRTKGPAKRKDAQKDAFKTKLADLLEQRAIPYKHVQFGK